MVIVIWNAILQLLIVCSEFLKAKCLMNCEVALILEHKYDQLQQMADDPMNQMSQYVNLHLLEFHFFYHVLWRVSYSASGEYYIVPDMVKHLPKIPAFYCLQHFSMKWYTVLYKDTQFDLPCIMIYYLYVVLLDHDSLSFPGCLRNHSNMWSALADTRILVLSNKFESILLSFIHKTTL